MLCSMSRDVFIFLSFFFFFEQSVSVKHVCCDSVTHDLAMQMRVQSNTTPDSENVTAAENTPTHSHEIYRWYASASRYGSV